MSVAVITGASSGIGEATARRLAREADARLVLVARREDRLRALAESLPSKATWLAADLTDEDAPERVLQHVRDEHGSLTLLVNNAGSAWRASVAERRLLREQGCARTLERRALSGGASRRRARGPRASRIHRH